MLLKKTFFILSLIFIILFFCFSVINSTPKNSKLGVEYYGELDPADLFTWSIVYSEVSQTPFGPTLSIFLKNKNIYSDIQFGSLIILSDCSMTTYSYLTDGKVHTFQFNSKRFEEVFQDNKRNYDIKKLYETIFGLTSL
jgi:hypothetical protein